MSDEWIDQPDGDGWWWRQRRTTTVSGPAPSVVCVYRDVEAYEACGERFSNFADFLWQRVRPHSPAPKPLPKSRTVELTAKVCRRHPNSDYWDAKAYADGDSGTVVGACGFDSQQKSIKWVRDTYGIEPEVES